MILEPESTSVMLSMASYSNFDLSGHIRAISNGLKSTRENRLNSFSLNSYNYFKPHFYYCWGEFDLITLIPIDNSQVITKIIQPELYGYSPPSGFTKTKLVTGLIYKGIGLSPLDLINLKGKDCLNHLVVSNLKINNSWLLGNGNNFLFPAIEHISKLLNGEQFFLLNTFNSYELCLILFGNDLNHLNIKINQIRELFVDEITDLQIEPGIQIEGVDGRNKLSQSNSNLFVDSHSFFGAGLDSKGKLSITDDGLTSIHFELEAKPGHTRNACKAFSGLLGSEEKGLKILSGKYDLVSEFCTLTDFETKVYPALKKKNSELCKHIRSFKTVLSFKCLPDELKTRKHFIGKPNELIEFDFGKINAQLKRLKISKSIRNQIIKLFVNYKNALADNVHFNLFLDLVEFVRNFLTTIKEDSEYVDAFFKGEFIWSNKQKKGLSNIEEKYLTILHIFIESYYLRFVNDRNMSETSDFLIPYNAQIQSIASAYDNYFKLMATGILGINLANRIILSFDDKKTEANRIHVKFSTYNIFEPGIMFALSIKEILTLKMKDEPIRKKVLLINKSYKELLVEAYFERYPDSEIQFSQKQLSAFDFEYLIVDFFRWKYFFKEDFEYFYYWHLALILEFPGNYDADGQLKREFSFREVLRLTLLANFINFYEEKELVKADNIARNPPNIESRGNWNKSFKIVSEFLSESGIHEFFNNLKRQVTHIRALLEDHFQPKKLKSRSSLKDSINQIYNNEVNEELFYLIWQVSDSHLWNIYQMDGKTPAYLSREWLDGTYSKNYSYHFNTRESFFLFDPQGGTFFHDFKKMNVYAENRNAIFSALMHLSAVYKKSLFTL
jgi:hypothetical protein